MIATELEMKLKTLSKSVMAMVRTVVGLAKGQ